MESVGQQIIHDNLETRLFIRCNKDDYPLENIYFFDELKCSLKIFMNHNCDPIWYNRHC